MRTNLLACLSVVTFTTFAVAAPTTQSSQPTHDDRRPVRIVIHADEKLGTISPWIYGSNQPGEDPASRYTFIRHGGNRMTAYNWENNASNAGADWHHQNDDYLGGGNVPGEVVRIAATKALANGQTFIATVPCTDYVAADKSPDGDVQKSGPDFLKTRFKRNVASKGAPLALTPDINDDVVAQDEFVHWLEHATPAASRTGGASVWYALDNEPDIWAGTHARIHPQPLTYAELIERNVLFATAIKSVAPDALVFGFVSYGWAGFTSLQSAPDAEGRNVLDVYLDAMKKAEADSGRRLIDVLDLHWYPEAVGGGDEKTGVRITDSGPRGHEPAVNEARVQATRSLWDPTYRETSWIDRTLGGPITLIPRIRATIDAHYPGTKLALTEYNFGGGSNASGAVAEADALGIFGREGLFAAALWSLGNDEKFTRAAFDAYRNYDGKGSTFGETSLRVDNSDAASVGSYASTRAKDGATVVVITNRASHERTIQLTTAGAKGTAAHRWQLEGGQPAMVSADAPAVAGDAMEIKMPPMSVTTIELK